ncbi:MAG TPA: hypothetical protein VIV12_15945 [Streptosporangiaceae bacterium]
MISSAYTPTAVFSAWARLALAMPRRSRSLIARVFRSLNTSVVCRPRSMSQPGNSGNRCGYRSSLAAIGSRHRSNQARSPPS